MKYTIEGFNQATLVEYGLNATDACILRYVVDFWHSGKMTKVTHEGKDFIWIKYDAVIEALPCIEIKSKIALARRFKKYIDCGLMEHYTHTTGGTFSCYRFTEKYDPLIEKYEPLKLKSKNPLNSKVRTKDSSINDSSINKINKETATRILFYLNEKAKKKYRVTDNSLKDITARLKEGYTEEECKKVIEIKVSHWAGDPKMGEYLRYITLFNKTKFPIYLEEKKKKWLLVERGYGSNKKEEFIRVYEDDPRLKA